MTSDYLTTAVLFFLFLNTTHTLDDSGMVEYTAASQPGQEYSRIMLCKNEAWRRCLYECLRENTVMQDFVQPSLQYQAWRLTRELRGGWLTTHSRRRRT
jgi:hypothetical protein